MKKSKLAARLALANACFHMAAVARPSADDEDPDGVEEFNSLLDEADVILDRITREQQESALRLLRDGGRAGEHARAEARSAIERRFGQLVVSRVSAFGHGWRDAGHAVL